MASENPRDASTTSPSPLTDDPVMAQEHHLIHLPRSGAQLTLNDSDQQVNAVDVLVQRYDDLIIRRDEGLHDPRRQIVLSIGDNQFNVPIKELCKASCHFRMRVHEALKRKSMPVIRISDHDPEVVHVFADWLKCACTFNEGAVCDLQIFSYTRLFQAFIFGEHIQALPFQNDIVDVIAAKLSAKHSLEPGLPKLCYMNTPEDSPLRRMLVDAYAIDADPTSLLSKAAYDNLHVDFLRDLATALFTLRDELQRSRPRPYNDGPAACERYHNHDLEGDKKCERRKFTIHASIPMITNEEQEVTTPATTPLSGIDTQPTTPGVEATSTPFNTNGTRVPRSGAKRGIAMIEHAPFEGIIKLEEPVTPCPPPSKRRKLVGKGSEKKPFVLD